MSANLESLKVLIGGNPGGATHFLANFLTECGFPTMHEGLFRDPVSNKIVPNEKATFPHPFAECNYTVVDWCSTPGVNHLHLIMLVRNPYAVLNSILSDQADKGEVLNPNRVMRDMLARWNGLLSTGRVVFECRVEFDLKLLCDFLGVKFIANYAPKKNFTHSKGRTFVRGPEDIKGYSESSRLHEFSQQYGYA